MRVYLDNCCLNRPFDDQSHYRIWLEAEAVQVVLALCEKSRWQLVLSEVSKFEILQTPNEKRRNMLGLIFLSAKHFVKITDAIVERSKHFQKSGLSSFDALHLACAENHADVFLTVDDRLLERAQKIPDSKVKINNPLIWLKEVL